MFPSDRRDPAIAALPRLGAAEHFFRLDDGRVLGFGSEEIGFEEGMVIALFGPDGREQARLARDLWLGSGFLGPLCVLGPRDIAFDFPEGVAWRLSVGETPRRLGPNPLRLRRG